MIHAFRLRRVSKQRICRDLIFFESNRLKNKYQIESRFFVSNLYTSNRILKRAEIAI